MVRNPNTYGSIINVCTGKPVAVQGILNLLIEIGGMKIDVEIDPARVKGIDLPNHYGSTERLARMVGVVPELDLKATLKDILNQIETEVLG